MTLVNITTVWISILNGQIWSHSVPAIWTMKNQSKCRCCSEMQHINHENRLLQRYGMYIIWWKEGSKNTGQSNMGYTYKNITTMWISYQLTAQYKQIMIKLTIIQNVCVDPKCYTFNPKYTWLSYGQQSNVHTNCIPKCIWKLEIVDQWSNILAPTTKIQMTHVTLTFDLLTWKWYVTHHPLIGCILATYEYNPGNKQWATKRTQHVGLADRWMDTVKPINLQQLHIIIH